MKKHFRTLWMLLLCITMAVAVAGISACSVLMSVIEDDDDTSGGDGTDVSGKYQIDLSEYNEEWYYCVVDYLMWKNTAAQGAYAYDTLVLNSDGSYALTKEMGADETATQHWSTDKGATDVHFSTYTYYGTYTVADDGVTVTLSEVTSIAYEVDVFEISLEQGQGTVIEYTETDDLTSPAGTGGDETVIDLWYGFYLIDSGMGNCEQVITLGSYDYGDFSFPVEEEEVEEDTRAYYALEGYENGEEVEGVYINLYEDYTYTFVHTDYALEESGTYSWDRASQQLILVAPDEDATETVATISGDKISLTYYYSEDDTVYYDFIGSVDGLEEIICEVVMELIPTADSTITLKLYGDETYTYTDASLGVRETGTYEYDTSTGILKLILPDGSTISSATATETGNILNITYVSSTLAASTQTFVGSVATATDSLVSTTVYSFTAGTNADITFTLKKDGTYVFAWPQSGVSETGTWEFVENVLTITDSLGRVTTADITLDYSNSTAVSTISFTYYSIYSDQLLQSYTGLVSELVEAMLDKGMITEVYSFTAGTNAEITFTTYSNGMYLFAWPDNGVYEYGGWSLANNTLTITDPLGQVTTADIAYEGTTTMVSTISFTYYLSYYADMYQDYTGTVSGLMTAMEDAGMITEVYSFTPGKSDDITFTLYSNGMYLYSYSAYSVYEYGSWSLANNTLTITDPLGQVTTADIAYEGTTTMVSTISFTYYLSYSSALSQAYTGTLSELMANMEEAGMITEVYSFKSGKNADITFKLYSNGMYEFAWADVSVHEYGSWSLADNVLTITDPNGTVTTADIAYDTSGSTPVSTISFTYALSYNSGLDQAYTGTLSELVANMEEAGMITEVYSFTAGTNSAVTFTLYSNGMYEFAWADVSVYEFGTWSYTSGSLTIKDPNGTATEVTISGDDISFTYYYSYMKDLNQSYTGSVSELEEAIGSD